MLKLKAVAWSVIVFNVFVGATYAQQIYRWKDAQGNIHYTDNPTLASQNKAAEVSKPIAQTVGTSTTLSEKDVQEMKQQAALKIKNKQAAQQDLAQRKQKCLSMKNQLTFLKTLSHVISGRNADGSLHYFSDQEHKQYIANKESEYAKQCD